MNKMGGTPDRQQDDYPALQQDWEAQTEQHAAVATWQLHVFCAGLGPRIELCFEHLRSRQRTSMEAA